MGRLLSFDEFQIIARTKNPNFDNIEILSEYTKTNQPLKCKCKICGNEWIVKEAHNLYRSSCKRCGHKRTNQSMRYTYEDFLEKVYNKNPIYKDVEIISVYKDYKTPIQCRCKICNHEWEILPRCIKKSTGCNNCHNPFLQKGVNDVATLYPQKIKYFVNINDAYTHTPYSSDVIPTRCCECGYIREMTVINLITQKQVGCPICGDGISYPNKFAHSFLKQLPVSNLKFEYNTTWSEGKRYDNYFEFKGKKYIVEMDGRFHYTDNNLSHHSLENTRKIDALKDKMADGHDITVIRIDSRQSNIDYIRSNILNSHLSEIFDLSNIDWDLCDKMAQKSLVKQVCDYYNEHKNESDTDIGKIFDISQATVSHYLNKGTELKWCDYVYNPKLLGRKFSPYFVYVYDNNYNFINKYESLRKCAEQMSIINNTSFTYFTISKHCENGMLYKNFYFEKKYKKNVNQEVGDE